MTTWTRHGSPEAKFERSILIGLIVSEDFLKVIRPRLSPQIRILAVPYAQIVAKCCTDFFDDFGRAPGREIQSIFQDKRSGLDPATEGLELL